MRNRDMPAMPPNAGWRDNEEIARGLTKREYIATQAMQGLLITAKTKDAMHGIPSLAVSYADALLKALGEDDE